MQSDWDPGLSVGVEQIDVEHRQILRRVRQLAGAVMDGRADEIRSALKFLQAYLAEHFVHEQEWMSEAGYPGAREHTRVHATMLAGIADAREHALDDAGALVRAAAELTEALDEHMRTDDLKLGRFFTARENLRLLAEAGPGVGAALTPLPGGLAAVAVRPAARPSAAAGADGDPPRE